MQGYTPNPEVFKHVMDFVEYGAFLLVILLVVKIIQRFTD